jgi:hypothetical protein
MDIGENINIKIIRSIGDEIYIIGREISRDTSHSVMTLLWDSLRTLINDKCSSVSWVIINTLNKVEYYGFR